MILILTVLIGLWLAPEPAPDPHAVCLLSGKSLRQCDYEAGLTAAPGDLMMPPLYPPMTGGESLPKVKQ